MLGFMVSIWGCKEEGKKEKYMLSSCCVNSIHESNMRHRRTKKGDGEGGWGRWRITISQCALVLNNNNDDDDNNNFINFNNFIN